VFSITGGAADGTRTSLLFVELGFGYKGFVRCDATVVKEVRTRRDRGRSCGCRRFVNAVDGGEEKRAVTNGTVLCRLVVIVAAAKE